jgi:hypothetical protein
MKYYLIDEITHQDMDRLSEFLKNNATMSGLEKVFWVNIPENYFNEIQAGHSNCRPYFFALELGSGMLKAELFIRTLTEFNCSCSGCADSAQTSFIINFVDKMIEELNIRT